MEKERIQLNNINKFYYITKKKKLNSNFYFKILFFMMMLINSFILVYLLNNMKILSNQILNLNNKQKSLLNFREKFIDDINKNSKQPIINNIKNENNETKNNFESIIDKDMIGLRYPEINYDYFKYILISNNFSNALINFLEQLEIKLLYLEKEINVTKLYTFFTARNLYLQNNKIDYDDWNITELHNIINWLVIHKSTQLKGIASDKYLACKYVKLKLNKDLCEHRIAVYNNLEEINFEELIKKGDIVLKISNGCHDLVYIRKNEINKIEVIKQKVSFFYNREYNLKIPEFFHLYSKKRIIVENIFLPFSDLYEFKFFIINRNIKFILLLFFINDKQYQNFYDQNYEILSFSDVKNFVLFSKFEKVILEQLKEFALKLSEDFRNFIRVDLYIFHNKIYLSELTFDSFSGMPMRRTEKIVLEAGNEWQLAE